MSKVSKVSKLILWLWLKSGCAKSCWQQEVFSKSPTDLMSMIEDEDGAMILLTTGNIFDGRQKYFQKPETNLISYQIWWGRWGPDPDLIRISRPPLSLWCITWCNMIHNAMSSVWLLFSSPLPQMSPFWGDLLPLSPYCTKNGQTRTSGDGDTLCSMDRAILVMVILMVMNWTNLIPN